MTMKTTESQLDGEQAQDLIQPDLRIVLLNQLIPHEKFDHQRLDPLIESLKREGVLKNPPIVTALNNGSQIYVVLDGANRATALSKMGLQYALVQVIDYDSDKVQLLTWYHVVSQADREQIIQHLKNIAGLELIPSQLIHARAELARHNILAYVLFANGDVITLRVASADLRQRNDLLHQVVDGYIQSGRLDRTNSDNLNQLLEMYPNMTAAFIFPQYTPAEILDLTQAGMTIPPGLTRHIVHGRALHLKYPLDKLSDSRSLEEKNIDLREWVQDGFRKRKIRFYAESVFIFDE
jgi:hypothetical protein